MNQLTPAPLRSTPKLIYLPYPLNKSSTGTPFILIPLKLQSLMFTSERLQLLNVLPVNSQSSNRNGR
jgi:hypothetical protein